jgi:hypothetical protein
LNDWLELQVSYRWAGWRPGQTLYWTDDLLAACSRTRDMAVFDSFTRSYSALNGFDKICTWSAENQCFERSEKRPGRPRLGIRLTRFANLVNSWGLQGKFLTNWCDAQGWNYPERLPGLGPTPVIQFSRRPTQRGQVVLMPLPFHYMGPGGPNLPLQSDPVPFRKKRNTLAWRGSFTGTQSDWIKEMWWADSLFGPGPSSKDFENGRATPRWRTADALRDCGWADVKFALSKEQSAQVSKSVQLEQLMSGLTGHRLSMEDQRQHKFLLVIDGNDFGSNKYWSLLSNSVVLMVESEWETALDAGLLPNVHYVPVKATRESIQSTIESLLLDEQRCEAIIAAAHAQMAGQLNTSWREAADWLTLQEYSCRLKSIPILPGTWSYARR